jgi:hypothetical protein
MQSPTTRHDPGTGVRDAARLGVLMLHKQRDAHYERPCAPCERGCVLHGTPASSIAVRRDGAGLASARGLADGCSEAERCCCVPLGARVRASKSVRGACISLCGLGQ